MKQLAVLVMVLLLMTGVVYAKDYEVNKKAGDYGVLIKIDRNPPIAGKNNVDISVKDASGKPVTDARVVVEYSMAPMPGMPAANYKAEAGLKGETYKAVISPSMTGPWNVAVKVTRSGKTDTAKFTIDAK
jgi:hypothetical protein